MIPIKKLLKEIESLNNAENYRDVVNKLPDSLLESYENADLYAEKAIAHYKLKEYNTCKDILTKSLSINPLHAKANTFEGHLYLRDDKNEEAIACYKKAIETAPHFGIAYCGMGDALLELDEYEMAKENYNKALEISPDLEFAYNGFGNIYLKLEQYDKAIEYFYKTSEKNPKSIAAYNNLGVAYSDLGQYEKAIEYYTKALVLDPNDIDVNLGIGSCYLDTEQYPIAINFLNKVLETNPKDEDAIYNRALTYFKTKQYKKALSDYELYVTITKDKTDFYAETAYSKIEELNKILQDDIYTSISELVDKIKKHLLFTDECVTHYTSLSVTKALILDDSNFRLSEGTFLNDTSEGRELFNYLEFHSIPMTRNDVIAQPFSPKPFIGSFVSENKHDDLTLWRMYGKEAKDEARGCAITINKNSFLKNLQTKLTSDNKIGSQLKADSEFNFYRVAYRKQSTDLFVIPGMPEGEKKLNAYMKEMHGHIQKFITQEKENNISVQNILELLNEIAYLFKSIEYQYEHEVRLVIKGIGFEKFISKDFTPPRVYVELVSVNSALTEITLGPKVERPDEWASAFYYSLDKKQHRPSVLISHLPFK